MATGNGRTPAMQQAMFSAFDEIVLDVQKLEREIYYEKTLCQKLNERLEELDAEEKEVQKQTVALLAKSQENFKKEVDVQAALDCITKTLQLEKDRHAGLRHQLERANNKAVEQNQRLTANEEKYRALWDSYRAVYENFPLVKEVQRMTDLVEHDKIKLMQANYDLRETHNQLLQMGKISELAKKVELVNLAEVFCEHAASERKIVEMQRQMSQLQASVARGMERKQQLLARFTPTPTNTPARATLPFGRVASMPVASCTDKALGNITSLLNLQTLPQTPMSTTSYSRQASQDIVRARYAKQSWPVCGNESSFSSEESQPQIVQISEPSTSVSPQETNFSLPNSQTPRDTPTKPTDVVFSSQKSSEEAMQVESSPQDQPQTLEAPMIICDSGPQNLESMEHYMESSQPKGTPMEEDVEPCSQDLPIRESPREFVQPEILTQLNMGTHSSQYHPQSNHVPNNCGVLAFPNQEHVSNIDVAMPPATPKFTAAQAVQDLPGNSTFEADHSALAANIHRGTRAARERRPIIPGIPVLDSREDVRVAEVPPQQSEWPPSPFIQSTHIQEQGATSGGPPFPTGGPNGNAVTSASGNEPGQPGNSDDNMDCAPSGSQDLFEASAEDFNCSQHSVTNSMSRVEYLKKLRQSPEFHYSPRLMFNRQELDSQQMGSSSPYFQPLVSEASAHRNQAGPPLQESNKQTYEHSKELQARRYMNEQLQCSEQNEQLPSEPLQGQQLPSQQAPIQKPGSQQEGIQFSNQAHQLPVQQFSSKLPQGQLSHSQVQQPLTQQISGRSEVPTEIRSQNDFQQTKIQYGSQEGLGSAETTGHYGSQSSTTAQTTHQVGSLGNGSAQPTNETGAVNIGYEQAESQFGSQGNSIAQNTTQASSQGNGISVTSNQIIHQTIMSPISDHAMCQDNNQFTPRKPLSQGNDVFYTPRQSEGNSIQIEVGDGDYGGSPLSTFLSPGETLGQGRQDPTTADVHDSSSNESFQYKSPCCSPPPSEPAGFSFMGSAPPQQTSMFGAPTAAEDGSGDAQQKPRSEAFTFNFSSNSSKPSVFKLF